VARDAVTGNIAFDILGVGVAAVDDVLEVERMPPADGQAGVIRRSRRVGGLVAAALAAAARLGRRCAFAGALGQDADAEFVLAALRSSGVDTEHAVRAPGAAPVRSWVLVDRTAASRTILFDLQGVVGAHPIEPDAALIAAASVVLVDDVGAVGAARVAAIARDHGVPVVADISVQTRRADDGLCALADHLVVSSEVALQLTGRATPAEAVATLWSAARDTVVVTCGGDGAWVRSRDDASAWLSPAMPVSPVDTLGCGDVYHGAYAAALVAGLTVRNRVRYAAAAAALKSLRSGGFVTYPDNVDVENAVKASW
jgi:sulfofructose kinase